MKKLLLALSLFGLFGSVSAQMNIVITDSSGAVVTGSTVNYTIPCNLLDTRIWHITNAGGNQITIKVKKTILTLNDPGATVYFCTDINCYSPSQTLSLAVAVAGSGGSELLTTDHFPNNIAGVTLVRYTVINQANLSDSAYFLINYTSVCSPGGINSPSIVKPTVSNPAPNPASSYFTVNYKLGSTNPAGAKMVIYNMLGDRVMETIVEENEGTIKMDVSNLEQGIYFCNLESEGRMLSTRRLVVTH
ncbi:MAG: T9SS type A sorting domain-containing protein [Bacteroidetes bacterium]|nr:T9SS type A sorting domain-containing protein [Bacteroidota bacterium]